MKKQKKKEEEANGEMILSDSLFEWCIWPIDANHDKTWPTKSLKYFHVTLVFLRRGHEYFVSFYPWISATFSPILTNDVQNFYIHSISSKQTFSFSLIFIYSSW